MRAFSHCLEYSQAIELINKFKRTSSALLAHHQDIIIGNSFTQRNDLPGMLAAMAGGAGSAGPAQTDQRGGSFATNALEYRPRRPGDRHRWLRLRGAARTKHVA